MRYVILTINWSIEQNSIEESDRKRTKIQWTKVRRRSVIKLKQFGVALAYRYVCAYIQMRRSDGPECESTIAPLERFHICFVCYLLIYVHFLFNSVFFELLFSLFCGSNVAVCIRKMTCPRMNLEQNACSDHVKKYFAVHYVVIDNAESGAYVFNGQPNV